MDEKIIRAINELENYRSYVTLTCNLQRKVSDALKRSGPNQRITAQIDANRGGYVPPAHPDAYTDLSVLAKKQSEIANLMDKINAIEDGLAMLGSEERMVLVMKHMDQWTMAAIAEYLGYSSRQSIYTLYSKALKKFAKSLA